MCGSVDPSIPKGRRCHFQTQMVAALELDRDEFLIVMLFLVAVVRLVGLALCSRVANAQFAVAKANLKLAAGCLIELHFKRGGPNDRVVADAAGKLNALGIDLAGKRA